MLPMDHIYVQNIQGVTVVDLVCLGVVIAQGTWSNVDLSFYEFEPAILLFSVTLNIDLQVVFGVHML
jgi:hypothetical protein